MKKNDDRSGMPFLAGMVIGIILAVVVGGCLIMSKVIKVEDEEELIISDIIDNDSEEKDTKITETTFNGEKVLVSNLTRETIYISSAGVSGTSIKRYDYYVDLKESGKVYVRAIGMENTSSRHEGYLSNVSDVIDIVKLSVPGEPDEQLIYILQANGDVYYYKVGDGANGKFAATKVDNVANIVKIFIYDYPLNGAVGGTWSIVGIKDNGETIEIEKVGV